MGVWGRPESELTYSLCNSCARAVPQECSWIDKGIRDGLNYENRFLVSGHSGRVSEIVSITYCPNYY